MYFSSFPRWFPNDAGTLWSAPYWWCGPAAWPGREPAETTAGSQAETEEGMVAMVLHLYTKWV